MPVPRIHTSKSQKPHLETHVSGLEVVLKLGDVGGIGVLHEGVVDQAHHKLAKSRGPRAFVAHRRRNLR